MTDITDNPYFRFLGYNRGYYFFISKKEGQVRAFSNNQLTSAANLYSLAPLTFWEQEFPKPRSPGVNTDTASSAIIEASQAAGIYNPDRIRGRGAWIDDGRVVVHLGDVLLVDNVPTDPETFKTALLYEQAEPFGIVPSPPASDAEAQMMALHARSFGWESPTAANVLAGWTMSAMVGGAMVNRPTLYVSGVTRAGKTTIMTEYIRAMLGPLCLAVASQRTSEAGIRQVLHSDSLAVVYDEPETDDAVSKARVQAVLDLARVSFSEDEARIALGTQDHRGVMFSIRSMFALASIGVAATKEQDSNRAAIVRVKRWAKEEATEQEALFRAARERMRNTFTVEYRARMLSRAASLVHVIRDNAAIIQRAVTQRHGSARLGQVYGTIIAGWCATQHCERISLTDADLLLDDFIPSQTALDSVEPEMKPVIDVANVHIQFRIGHDVVERTVSECALIAAGRIKDKQLMDPEVVSEFLRRRGLMVKNGYLWISNHADMFARMVARDETPLGLAAKLLNVPGARKSPNPMRFMASSPTTRAVGIPLALFESAQSVTVPQTVVPFPGVAMQGDD